MIDVTHQRKLLLRRLGELGIRVRSIDAELVTHADPDWSEQAVEREDDEALEQLRLAATEEVRVIGAALTRIRDGHYGVCTRCGERIGEDRLSTLPATPLCRSCAQEVEA
jgi:RNA polymerase-binding transcription factor DksA